MTPRTLHLDEITTDGSYLNLLVTEIPATTTQEQPSYYFTVNKKFVLALELEHLQRITAWAQALTSQENIHPA